LEYVFTLALPYAPLRVASARLFFVQKQAMHSTTNTQPNAFSASYASQIEPFKTKPFKKPVLVQPPHDVHHTIAVEDEGKRGRMLKSRI